MQENNMNELKRFNEEMNTVGAWDFYTQRWCINKQNKKCANALPEFRWSSQDCGETKIEFRDVSYAWPLTHLSSRQGHFQGELILSHSDIMLSSCWKFICDISVQHKLVLRGCLFLWSLGLIVVVIAFLLYHLNF